MSAYSGDPGQRQHSTIRWLRGTTTHSERQSPFLPSNATSRDGQFMNPKSFATAQYCGHCHQEAYHEWRESVHSNSFRAPWYLKNVNMLIDEKGVRVLAALRGLPQPRCAAERGPVARDAEEAAV